MISMADASGFLDIFYGSISSKSSSPLPDMLMDYWVFELPILAVWPLEYLLWLYLLDGSFGTNAIVLAGTGVPYLMVGPVRANKDC